MPHVCDKIKREARTFAKLEQSASHSAGTDLRLGTENFEWYLNKIFQKHPTLIQFMKSNEFGINDLGGKKFAALIALKYDKSDLYSSMVEQVKQEKLDEEQKCLEMRLAHEKELEDKHNEQVNAVKQYLPGIELLFDSATIHMNSSPWSPRRPKLNKDGSIEADKCTDGIYVVRDNITIYRGESHYAIYFCDMTVFEKKNTKFNILFNHSFYSGLTSVVYGKVDNFCESEISSHDSKAAVIPYSTFMKNNKIILEEFIEKNKKLLTEHRTQEYIRSDN